MSSGDGYSNDGDGVDDVNGINTDVDDYPTVVMMIASLVVVML